MFGYFPRRIPFIIPIAFFLGVMASSALGGIGGVGFGLFFALPFLLFKILLVGMFFKMFFGFGRRGYGPRGYRGDRQRQPRQPKRPLEGRGSLIGEHDLARKPRREGVPDPAVEEDCLT